MQKIIDGTLDKRKKRSGNCKEVIRVKILISSNWESNKVSVNRKRGT